MTANAATALSVPMTVTEAVAHLDEFLTELRGQFRERDHETRGILLALISRTHIFFGGPPGTAKSALVNSFAEAAGLTYFARLIMRQSVPEELFGPTDLLALREGRHERRIEGYLPTADFAFLDECFKGSSAILNALLTVMNERAYDHGNTRIEIPLQILAGASNELPADAGLAALWDRFLLRFWVKPIVNADTWEEVMFAAEPGGLRLDFRAIETVRSIADGVNARSIAPMLRSIKADLETQHGIVASDRRWRQCIKLIRASAALDGRTEAVGDDLMVLADCLWEKPTDRPAIFGVVARNSNPDLTKAMELHDAAKTLVDAVDLSGLANRAAQPNDAVKLATANQELKRVQTEIKTLPATAAIAPLQLAVDAWLAEVGRAALRAMGI